MMSGLDSPNPILMPGMAKDLVRDEATTRLENRSTIPERVMSVYPGTSSRRVSSRNRSTPMSSRLLAILIILSLGSTLPVGLLGLQMYTALAPSAISSSLSASILKSSSAERRRLSTRAPTILHCWVYSAKEGVGMTTLSLLV